MKTALPRYGSATCPACRFEFSYLPVQAGLDGPYVEIETVPCHDDECTKKLCSCCDQFTCECCGLSFCMDHLAAELEPECRCIQVDVDRDDASGCPLHGSRHPHMLRFCRLCNPTVQQIKEIPMKKESRPRYIVLIEAMLVKQAQHRASHPHGDRTPENDLRMEYCANCRRVSKKDDPYPLPENPVDGQECGELTWIGNGWDYWGCSKCVAEAREVDEREALGVLPLSVMAESGPVAAEVVA